MGSQRPVENIASRCLPRYIPGKGHLRSIPMLGTTAGTQQKTLFLVLGVLHSHVVAVKLRQICPEECVEQIVG